MEPPSSDAFWLEPLTRAWAAEISAWRYPPPCDCYDMSANAVEELLRPELAFHAVLWEERLVGFRSFGPDGRVPDWEYDDSALDTGGGLHPELTGRGLGGPALAAGLSYGRQQFAPTAFRVTVAELNRRARKVVESAGFRRTARFDGPAGRAFLVLVRPER